MTFQEFVDALYKAGWRSPLDAQHTEIKKLWDELCQRGMTVPFPQA